MLTADLEQDRTLLLKTQKHHIEKLCSPYNPSGILLCHKHEKNYRWLRKDTIGEKTLTVNIPQSDKQLAEQLAINLYRLVCIQYIQKQLSLTDNILLNRPSAPPKTDLSGLPFNNLLRSLHRRPHVPADFFHADSPYRPLILSHLQKEYADLMNWYLQDFAQNTDRPEHLIFPVKLNYNVRSKSEAFAADRLYEEGILFHYEELIALLNEGLFPDFVIYISAFEKYIWEHFGAMDKELYFNRSRGRILHYLDNHWFPGINMITTYETKNNPLTIEQINHQIRWLKNRYRLAFPDLPPDESFNMYDLAEHVRLQRTKNKS